MSRLRSEKRDGPDKGLEKSLKRKADEIDALSRVSRTITSSMNLTRMLNLIAAQICRVMRGSVCAIHVMEAQQLVVRGIFRTRASGAGNSDISFEGDCVGLAVKNRRSYVKNDSSGHSLMVVPLLDKDEAIGAMSLLSRSPDRFTKEDEDELEVFANQVSVAIENSKLLDNVKQGYMNTMKLLASVIDSKDSYTHDHSERVSRYAVGIADRLGLDEHAKHNLRFASFLHDIGKINIDSSILRKKGPLTREEWQKMREHPTVAAEIISKAGFLDDLIPIILYHHVHYKGGGYPPCDKKRGSIPVGARMLTVADAYEAMTSDRPYRPRMSKEDAIGELKRCSGEQFDPKLVESFAGFLTTKNNNRRSDHALWKI